MRRRSYESHSTHGSLSPATARITWDGSLIEFLHSTLHRNDIRKLRRYPFESTASHSQLELPTTECHLQQQSVLDIHLKRNTKPKQTHYWLVNRLRDRYCIGTVVRWADGGQRPDFSAPAAEDRDRGHLFFHHASKFPKRE